jgi:hypothetical protein
VGKPGKPYTSHFIGGSSFDSISATGNPFVRERETVAAVEIGMYLHTEKSDL